MASQGRGTCIVIFVSCSSLLLLAFFTDLYSKQCHTEGDIIVEEEGVFIITVEEGVIGVTTIITTIGTTATGQPVYGGTAVVGTTATGEVALYSGAAHYS